MADVLTIDDVIVEDQLGCFIANNWLEWNMLRQNKMQSWREVREYVYATDTTQTTNSKLPWTNKTTIPKLCQIRDNLFANYMASMFPKRKWLAWEGNTKDDADRSKREAIVAYMANCIEQPQFKNVVASLVQDYIDYGNCFAGAEWVDDTVDLETKQQVGYVGPLPKRFAPLDIVFNPIASSFEKSPKIIRSLVSMAECKEILERVSTPETEDAYKDLWEYMKLFRNTKYESGTDVANKDRYLTMDGFTSFQAYLESGTVELLTFMGDAYDMENDKLYKNHVIVVADRHKVIHKEPNESYFGKAPIFHSGWRPRQDNLWAMGPLDNLIGLQYRLDHVENLKADVFDLLTFPPLEIKGQVEDFTWGPFEKIYVGDDGAVKPIVPPFQILDANSEIAYITGMMEEMAGSPKEAMGFRTPGEKTAYEVQRLENAASRIFQSKITQFEEQILEPMLNAMLELARRKMSASQFRVFDDELQSTSFMSIAPDDIAGNGTLKPMAARHFAEKAERIQNLNSFFQSPIGQDQAVSTHFSTIKMAKMVEDLLEIQEYELVTPYIRLAEQADAQRLAQAAQEQVMREIPTATGLGSDFDTEQPGAPQGGPIPQQPMDQAPSGSGPSPANEAGYPSLPDSPTAPPSTGL
jgi:hypothetical protein